VPELSDERYVRELFEELYGVQLRKIPESASRTFDFELRSSGQRVAAVEVKCLGLVPRTPENGWTRNEDGSMTRTDNGARRIVDFIHAAYKQLSTAVDPKVLVFVNDESLIDALDLRQAMQGYLVYGNGEVGRFKNVAPVGAAERRIEEEKYRVDLYIWINRYAGRTTVRSDGQPIPVHQQCGPHFMFNDVGYALARQFFQLPETPKPKSDPDEGVPTYQEMLLREAGIRKP
jgi:hypothetical protein